MVATLAPVLKAAFGADVHRLACMDIGFDRLDLVHRPGTVRMAGYRNGSTSPVVREIGPRRSRTAREASTYARDGTPACASRRRDGHCLFFPMPTCRKVTGTQCPLLKKAITGSPINAIRLLTDFRRERPVLNQTFRFRQEQLTQRRKTTRPALRAGAPRGAFRRRDDLNCTMIALMAGGASPLNQRCAVSMMFGRKWAAPVKRWEVAAVWWAAAGRTTETQRAQTRYRGSDRG